MSKSDRAVSAAAGKNRKPTPAVMAETQRRLQVANAALPLFTFAANTRLELDRGYVVVHWSTRGKYHSRRWMTRGQDFYPTWHGYPYWEEGETGTTALSQLIRWIQHKPVVPISTWRHWCGSAIKLAGNQGPDLLALLSDGGWPQHAECVLCHQQIEGRLDWWSLGGVSGPCCSYRSGCRQKGRHAE